MREHKDLRDLRIQNLQLEDTDISAARLAIMIESQPLRYLEVIRSDFSDEAALALSGQNRLVSFEVTGVGMTDAGLAALPLESLTHLMTRRSNVTPSGMQQLRRCERLVSLQIDGTQLDEASASVLTSLAQLRSVDIRAPGVTDKHVHWLRGMSRLKYAVIDGNLVSREVSEE